MFGKIKNAIIGIIIGLVLFCIWLTIIAKDIQLGYFFCETDTQCEFIHGVKEN